MKKFLIVLLTLAILACPAFAAAGEQASASTSWNLTIGNFNVAQSGTYALSGSSTQYGVKVSCDGYVTLVLQGDVKAAYIDCGNATVYFAGTGSLTVGSTVLASGFTLTGALGVAVEEEAAPAAAAPAASGEAAPAAAQQTAGASGEPAAQQTTGASGEPAAQQTAGASGEPAAQQTADASAEPAASEEATSGETAAEAAAEETAVSSYDPYAYNWAAIEIVLAVVVLVVFAVLMLSFGKKKKD